MPITRDKKLSLIHIPKAAGTSVVEMFDMIETSHARWPYYHQNYPDSYKIAFSRHPVDRFLSSYSYGRLKRSYWHKTGTRTQHEDYEACALLDLPTFTELFLADKLKLTHPCWLPQCNFVHCDRDVRVDYMGKVETLEEDIKRICAFTDRPVPVFKHVNTSPDISGSLPKELIQRIEKKYRKDIDLFHYERYGDR